jgi:hypothetical protein
MKPPQRPLPKDEFDRIFAKVPRLTVEVLIVAEEAGVLLALRDVEPCLGTWNLPGGTVRYGERRGCAHGVVDVSLSGQVAAPVSRGGPPAAQCSGCWRRPDSPPGVWVTTPHSTLWRRRMLRSAAYGSFRRSRRRLNAESAVMTWAVGVAQILSLAAGSPRAPGAGGAPRRRPGRIARRRLDQVVERAASATATA